MYIVEVVSKGGTQPSSKQLIETPQWLCFGAENNGYGAVNKVGAAEAVFRCFAKKLRWNLANLKY